MDNKQIARILRETAQLLEIDGAIIGRYRSYEKAAELIDGLPESIEQLVKEPEKLKELPGIGDRMVEHLEEIVKTGDYALRKKLLKKYPATILDLLQLQSLARRRLRSSGQISKQAPWRMWKNLRRKESCATYPASGKRANRTFSKQSRCLRNPRGVFIWTKPKPPHSRSRRTSKRRAKPWIP